jgi:cytochrome b561/polyisoprenoid-binding protein YceI
MNRGLDNHYTPAAKLLHWLVAGMIVLQFVLAKMAELASEEGSAVRELALLANHKSVGITILALAIVRLFWRQMNPPPSLPATMSRWQITASHLSHWSLYALLFAMPVTGWLMSSASAYSVSWFNLFQLPDMVAPNPAAKEVFEETHETLAKLLVLVAAIHIGAAIKHALFDKDGVLQRMVSAVSVVSFAVVIAIGVAWLGGAGKSSGGAAATGADQTNSTAVTESVTAESELPVWQIDYANSYIRFVGDQAGAEFEGIWELWSANLQFSPDQLDSSVFDVTVNTTSAETQDDDRDVTLADPEWFDTMNFPEAYFRAGDFSATENGYVADGQLIIKDVASPVQLTFTVTADSNSRVLVGTAQLDRLALGVGTGEWEDTDWVGKDVTVQVHVEALIGD